VGKDGFLLNEWGWGSMEGKLLGGKSGLRGFWLSDLTGLLVEYRPG
jgi:hypothetical protein